MMKRTTMKFLTLVCLGLISVTSMAEEVDRRLDASSDGVVSISNIAGSVEVIGWSRNEVEVTGSLGKNVEELIFERDGDEIEVTVRVSKGHGHSISSDLVINVPEKSSIEVVGVSADIDVQNVHGEQRLQSVSPPAILLLVTGWAGFGLMRFKRICGDRGCMSECASPPGSSALHKP